MNRSVRVSGKQLAKNELDRAFAAARRYARKSRAKSTWRGIDKLIIQSKQI